MIERSQDYRRIKRFTGMQPMICADIYYLFERESGEDLGIWTFHEWQDGALMHADMKCRGLQAKRSGIAALRWMFENTGFRKIYARTKVRVAQFMAVSIGMKYLYSDGDWRCYGIEA